MAIESPMAKIGKWSLKSACHLHYFLSLSKLRLAVKNVNKFSFQSNLARTETIFSCLRLILVKSWTVVVSILLRINLFDILIINFLCKSFIDNEIFMTTRLKMWQNVNFRRKLFYYILLLSKPYSTLSCRFHAIYLSFSDEMEFRIFSKQTPNIV